MGKLDDHKLFESLDHDGITTWKRFTRTPIESIQELSKTTSRGRVTIGKYYIHQMKALYQMVHEAMILDYEKGSKIDNYTVDDIERFTFKYIDSKKNDDGIVIPTGTSLSE